MSKYLNKSTGTPEYRERVSQPDVWELDYHLPDGHRVFALRDTSLGVRWAIADDSGATPPETDDGVLFLDIDLDRPLHIVKLVTAAGASASLPSGSICSIPLLALDGSLTRATTDPVSILILAHKYDWPVKAQWSDFARGERTYQVKEVLR
jgi:hypothetical protein